MVLSARERVSPFSEEFNWNDYTNELYHLSDDYGFLTIEQMENELKSFKMSDFSKYINCSWTVDDFVNFLYDSNSYGSEI
jgi:hypothetical protein